MGPHLVVVATRPGLFYIHDYDDVLCEPTTSAAVRYNTGGAEAAELMATFSTPRLMILSTCFKVLTPPP